MKVLYITTSYQQKANSAAIRNNAWVTGLIENGMEVDVLTIEWPKFMLSEFLRRNNKAKVIRHSLPELKALKLTKKGITSNNFIRVFINKLKSNLRDLIFFPDICKNWRKVVKRYDISQYDVVISSSDFKSSHLAAHELIKRTKKKWIQIWGDPWSSDINLNKLQMSRVKHKEYELLKDADQIIYVSDITKGYLQHQYPDLSEKMHYIPRGYYKIAISPNKDIVYNKYIDLIYTGILSEGRNIHQLIESISRYNDSTIQKIRLKLYGNYSSELHARLTLYPWIEVNESIDYDKILDIYSKSDLLLFISNGKNSTQIPGKFFDYAGTDKPIVCICSPEEPELYRILSKYDRCVLPESYSNESMIRMLYSAVEKIAMRYEPVEEFSPKAIGQQLLSIISKC